MRTVDCYCAADPVRFSAVLDAEDRHFQGDDDIVETPRGTDVQETGRLAAVRARLHTRRRSALCLSGGGIRSATVALGILQGLARQGLLGQLDYLSTVSGGGYTGAWLTRWRVEAARTGGNVPDPLTALGGDPTARRAEPKPVDQMRRYSRFLDPQIGVLSADVWSVIVTIVTNLVLNWLVLVPLIAAGVMVPLLHLHMTDVAESMVARGAPSPAWLVEAGGVALLAIAFGFAVFDLPSSGNARQPQARFLALMLAPLCLGKVLLSWSWVFAWMWGGTPSLTRVVLRDAIAFALPFLAAPIMLRLRGQSAYRWRPDLALAAATAGAIGACVDFFFRRAVFYGQPYVDAVQCDPILRLVAAFDVPVALLCIDLQIALVVGFGSHEMTDDDREWWARTAAWVAIVAGVWALAGGLALFGPGVVEAAVSAIPLNAAAAHAVLTFVTFFAGSVAARRANAAAANDNRSTGRVEAAILVIAIPFLVTLMLAIITALDLDLLRRMRPWTIVRVFTDTFRIPEEEDYWRIRAPELWLLFFGFVGGGLLMSRLISVNIFSLHGMYRNRLVRSFLGASRPNRTPNPFTGFDGEDDVAMWDLRRLPRPFHVINATMNQVTDNQLAWQERRALAFTVSPLHAGCSHPKVGFRCVAHYSDGLRLGTAIAISGAAVSSRMGELTSPVMSFLLTMFNARLGVWKGNPAEAGNKSWTRKSPPVGVKAILDELFSRTSATNPYVYLSDGGHFENLGLYEMVQRRCRYILVSDAASDPQQRFEDLANAVRKIRIDLGISIDFPRGLPIADGPAAGGEHFAVALIRYSMVDPPLENGAPLDDGVLIYVKASLSGDEPVDIVNYAKAHAEFPNESTADQWFTEAQFESYRALGQHMIESVLAARDATDRAALTLAAVFDGVRGGAAGAPAGRAPISV